MVYTKSLWNFLFYAMPKSWWSCLMSLGSCSSMFQVVLLTSYWSTMLQIVENLMKHVPMMIFSSNFLVKRGRLAVNLMTMVVMKLSSSRWMQTQKAKDQLLVIISLQTFCLKSTCNLVLYFSHKILLKVNPRKEATSANVRRMCPSSAAPKNY